MDKEREAFEDWYFETYKYHLVRDPAFKHLYKNTHANGAWAAWQARAKQTITLPVKDATGKH